MPERMIQEYKRKVQKQVRIMFAILVLGLGLGLYGVQSVAKDYAADKAIQIQAKQREADRLDAKIQRWNTNHTACGIRQLVDLKTLKGNRERARASSLDKTLSKSVRNRQKNALKDLNRSIKNGNRVIKLFGKIPTGFNCDDLPLNPPTK